MYNISITEIQYVRQLLQDGNMLTASERLGVRYNSFAKAILRFEEKIGIKDFLIKSKSGFIVNEKYQALVDEIKKTSDHYSRLQSAASDKGIPDNIHLYTSTTLFETLLIDDLIPYLEENKDKINMGMTQTDDFSEYEPGYNTISFVPHKYKDEGKYVYTFYHNFQQKLWASKECIEKYEGISSVDDIISKRIPVLLQSCFDPKGRGASLIGNRGIFEHFPQDSVNFVSIKGVRSIDLMTSKGFGIQAASEETTKLLDLDLLNICPNTKGENVPLYIKCSHETFKNENVQKLIHNIVSWKDRKFSSLWPSP